MGEREVTAYAPASVANVACGFDVLGLALAAPGDEVTARLLDGDAPPFGPAARRAFAPLPADRSRRSAPSSVRMAEITGDGGRLPAERSRNSASVAAEALLRHLDPHPPVTVELRLAKGVPLASGLGGSAASAVAAVVAMDALLGAGLARRLLLRLALEGERAACGAAHRDNAAASLRGGLVLVPTDGSPRVVELPEPPDLSVAVVRPHVEIETRKARALLGDRVSLQAATIQWGNLALFVAALHRGDWELIERSLMDVVAEPKRAPLVPGFEAAKRAALEAGAAGCGLSGSGPSLFALCRGSESARSAGEAMQRAFREEAALASDLFLSSAAAPGARVVKRGREETSTHR